MYAFSSKSGSEPFRALGDFTWNDRPHEKISIPPLQKQFLPYRKISTPPEKITTPPENFLIPPENFSTLRREISQPPATPESSQPPENFSTPPPLKISQPQKYVIN